MPSDGCYFCSSCHKAPARIGWWNQDRALLFTELPRGDLLGNSLVAGRIRMQLLRVIPLGPVQVEKSNLRFSALNSPSPGS